MASGRIRIKVRGLEELNRKFDSLPRRTARRAQVAVNDGVRRIAKAARGYAAPDRFSGELEKGIKPILATTRADKLNAGVIASAKHSAAREFGREPGSMPPAENLEKWAQKKLGDADLAFPVARAIAQRGIDAKPFMFPAYRDEGPSVIRGVARELNAEYRRLRVRR